MFSDDFCAAGVSDGRIPDSAMTASSSVSEELSASKARLGSDTYWSPMCASKHRLKCYDFGQIFFLEILQISVKLITPYGPN